MLARTTFAFMVPLTCIAFYFGQLTMPLYIEMYGDGNQSIFEIIALAICGVGVFAFNWF